MPKKIILIFLSICMLTSSVCYAQEANTDEQKKYKEGVYSIGKDIPKGEYMLLANDPDETAAYIIYDGKAIPGAEYKEKYTIPNEENYNYPDLLKRISTLRLKYSDISDNMYNIMFDDYFEYCTRIDLKDFSKTSDIASAVTNPVSPGLTDRGFSDLTNCYIKFVNCCAVPAEQVVKLDASRNGVFKAGRDIPSGSYTVEYIKRDMSDTKYFIINNGISKDKDISKSSDTLFADNTSNTRSITLKNGDYVAKRDVSLKSGDTVITHKPREIKYNGTDEKYDISKVRKAFREGIEDEIDKYLDNRYYHEKSKASSVIGDDLALVNKWLNTATNDAEKKYAYTVGEMYYIINEYLRGSVFSGTIYRTDLSRDGLNKISIGLGVIVQDSNSKIAPDTYRNLFKHIKNAGSFADIEYICDKIIADMF